MLRKIQMTKYSKVIKHVLQIHVIKIQPISAHDHVGHTFQSEILSVDIIQILESLSTCGMHWYVMFQPSNDLFRGSEMVLKSTFMSFPVNPLHRELYLQHASISAAEPLVQVISFCFVPLAYCDSLSCPNACPHCQLSLQTQGWRINLCQESNTTLHIQAQSTDWRLLMKIVLIL